MLVSGRKTAKAATSIRVMTQRIACDLDTVSTVRGSGWVRQRSRTHPLPRVVLTVSNSILNDQYKDRASPPFGGDDYFCRGVQLSPTAQLPEYSVQNVWMKPLKIGITGVRGIVGETFTPE